MFGSKKEAVDSVTKDKQPSFQIEQKSRKISIKHKFWEEIKKMDGENQALKNGLIKKFMQREDLTNQIRVDHRDVKIIEGKLKGIVDECGVKKGEQFRMTENEDELEVLYFVSKLDKPNEEKKEEQK